MASGSLLSLFWVGLVQLGGVLGQNVAYYRLELTWGARAPDGFEREVILVNDQFPGPVLEMNEGDHVVVEAVNHLGEDTSIHFHGIEMYGTPWSDGSPGVSQLPIPPNSTYTYQWTATQYGAYWYHSHSVMQLEDGLLGGIVIQPKNETTRPFRLIPEYEDAVSAMMKAERDAQMLVLSDFRHIGAKEAWNISVRAEMEIVCFDSILVNGKGGVECRGAEEVESLLSERQKGQLTLVNGTMTDKSCFPPELMAAFGGGNGSVSEVPRGIYSGCIPSTGSREVLEVKLCRGWVALHIVGAFSLITTRFSIDEHAMWVYAVDGRYVSPQEVQAITVTNGDRYSILVKLGKVGDFTMRVASILDPQILTGFATMKVRETGDENATFSGESEAYINDAGSAAEGQSPVIFQDAMAKPFPPLSIPAIADESFILNMGNLVPTYKWALNVTPLPALNLEARVPPFLFEPTTVPNVTISTRNNTWIDLVLITRALPNPAHPIHKHGAKMFLLGRGSGPWNYSSVQDAIAAVPESFNLIDPPTRDGFASLLTGLPAPGEDPDDSRTWMVLRYHSNNPGPWLLHCHILGHLMGGMQVVILDGLDVWPEVPQAFLEPFPNLGPGLVNRT